MSSDKGKALEEAYEAAISYLFHKMPISEMDIDSVIAEGTMIYGTTIDEHIFGIDDFKRILKMQAVEMEGLEPRFGRTPVFQHISEDETSALFVEEVKLTIEVGDSVSVSNVRMSFVMEKMDGSWKLIHAHGSKPVESEEDPWHVKEWQQEKEKLEQKVAEQTTDLQQKNRELEIEAATERIRARAMAMEKPDDILNVLGVIKEEIDAFELGNISTWLFTFTEDKKVIHRELADYHLDGDIKSHFTIFDPQNYSASKMVVDRWGQDFFSLQFEGDSLLAFLESVSELDPEQTQNFRKAIESGHITEFWQQCSSFSKGILGISFISTPPENAKQIQQKITEAFGLAYKRFEDLQIAEQRRKEAELEAAVERVRAHAMGMKEPDDIMHVLNVIKEEVEKFELENIGTWFWIFNEDNTLTQWDISEIDLNGTLANVNVTLDLDKSESSKRHIPKWDSTDYYTMPWKGNELQDLIDEVKKLDPDSGQMFQEAVDTGRMETYWQACAHFSNGVLGLDYPFDPPEAVQPILTKMASAFDMAYQRFEDLQEAEKRRKEAELEAAVERVRTRAMGMQNSDDFSDVLFSINKELQEQELNGQNSAYIWIRKDEDHADIWNLEHIKQDSDQKIYSETISFNDFRIFKRQIQDWEENPDFFITYASKEQLYELVDDIPKADPDNELSDSYQKELDQGNISELWAASAGFGPGFIGGDFLQEPDEWIEKVLHKMAEAFGMAYQRYEDLQKAEQRRKEAELEAAVERLRAHAMGMQTSDDLTDVLQILNNELSRLDLEGQKSAYIWLQNGDGTVNGFNLDLREQDADFKIYSNTFNPQNFKHFFKPVADNWKKNPDYSVTYTSHEAVKRHIKEMSHSDNKGFIAYAAMAQKAIESGAVSENWSASAGFGQGMLGCDFQRDPTDWAEKVIRKMSDAFGMAYQRFEDLQKAEQRAYESKVETSLERVRGMAAAMNHSDDLMQIAEEMFKELEILKINPLRYGLGMIDGKNKEAELWASTVNDGHYLDMLGTISLTWHPMLQKVFDAWDAQHEEVIYELKGKELSDYYQKVGKLNPAIPNLKDLQDPKNEIIQYVSFFPFKSGALYAFTHGEPSDEGKSILKRFAIVFEQAHIRYNDLQIAENQARLIREERDRLEIALNELHATQDQLVQQEKLASLGQLTAGIAHEIKNPLNFVNNFSDLSVELIKEARDEIKRQNAKGKSDSERSGEPRSEKSPFEGEKNDQVVQGDDAISAKDDPPSLLLDILDDIEANLKTIHKHGSRADSIVKSMLMHSRGGDGKMESTPVNPLIKEYVNLAFHGMRAGKEPINVEVDLQLDENVGEVPLVAEDFSRVILNLVNNAFDAMREKLTGDGGPKTGRKFPFEGGKDGKAGQEDDSSLSYHPKLTVRTNSENGKATIEIEDNGPGIPDEMKDKIMQPFFTTKKGTAGTGLGLSITNDIIKAHGGSLSINSIPSEKTVFIIQLD